MGLDEAVRVAGVGCRKNSAAADVLAAIDAALAAHGLERHALDAVAVVAHKGGEVGIAEAANALGLRLLEVEAKGIETLSRSPLSLEATGTASASEAAALAAAGEGARLLGPRIAAGGATCAIAESRP